MLCFPILYRIRTYYIEYMYLYQRSVGKQSGKTILRSTRRTQLVKNQFKYEISFNLCMLKKRKKKGKHTMSEQ